MRAKKFVQPVIYIILVLLSGLFLFPIIVTTANSFMSPFEVFSRYSGTVTASNGFDTTGLIHFVEMSLIPDMVSFKQYVQLLFSQPLYLGLFWNSLKITLPIVIGQLLVSVPGAYAFELSRFKHKEAVFFVYIVVMLMPLQVVLVPNYIMAGFLGIRESYLAIILPGIFNPFGVFLMRQYLKGMPKEYIEAAKVDGAGHLQILAHIIAPMIKTAAAALLILTFVEYWNVVDQAIVFIKEVSQEPLSAYLSRFAEGGLDTIFAASCFYMLPTVMIFIYGQENIVEGIQLSGIK
ncbi:MAG TPA: carbohydrate ABC transporter permease [Clostridiales bacterium]|nr:carbohydrate ABC transporter permease [Clostridiales bacterium]